MQSQNTSCVQISIMAASTPESREWATMLRSMYEAWAKKHGHEVSCKAQRESGRAFRTFMLVEGDRILDRLRVEAGLHRLVRASPHDPLGRRCSSFADVAILPCVADVGDDEPVGAWDPASRPAVRSYILDPYERVSDEQGDLEREDAHAVLDGDIDAFLDAGNLRLS